MALRLRFRLSRRIFEVEETGVMVAAGVVAAVAAVEDGVVEVEVLAEVLAEAEAEAAADTFSAEGMEGEDEDVASVATMSMSRLTQQ